MDSCCNADRLFYIHCQWRIWIERIPAYRDLSVMMQTPPRVSDRRVDRLGRTCVTASLSELEPVSIVVLVRCVDQIQKALATIRQNCRDQLILDLPIERAKE